MRAKPVVLGGLLALVCATAPGWAAVEKFAPASAVAAVRVRAVDDSLRSLSAAATLAGQEVPASYLYMKIGGLVADAPLGAAAEGFDGTGELLLVALNPKAVKSPLVLVVPVTGYRQYLAGMLKVVGTKPVKDPSGLDAVEFTKRVPVGDAEGDEEEAPQFKEVTVRRFLGDAGKWAIVAAAPEAVQAVAAQLKEGAKSLFDLALDRQKPGMAARNILAITAVQTLLEAYDKEVERLKKGDIFWLMPELGGMPGMVPGMRPAREPAPVNGAAFPLTGGPAGLGPDQPTQGPLAQSMNDLGRQLEEAIDLLEELDFAALGLDATEKGVTLTLWIGPRKGSELAGLTFPAPTGAPEFVKFLPAAAVLGVAAAVDMQGMKTLMDLVVERALPAEIPAEQRAKLVALVKQQVAILGGTAAVAVREAPPDGPPMVIDETVGIKDAAAARAYLREIPKVLAEQPAQQGLKMRATLEENVRSYGEAQVDRLTFTFDAADTTPAAQEAVKNIKMQFGDTVVAETAIVGKVLLVAVGGTDPVNRLIDAVKAGGGLAGNENYRLAMAGLPARRDLECYLAGKKFLLLAAAILDRQFAPPKEPTTPEEMFRMMFSPGVIVRGIATRIPGDLPVGMSVVLHELRMDAFVPAATVKALGSMGQPAVGEPEE